MKIELIEQYPTNTDLQKGQGHLTRLTKDNKTSLALWYCCHECGEDILVSDHTITINPDKTITVNPSLVCPTEGCTGHYWIKNNEIC